MYGAASGYLQSMSDALVRSVADVEPERWSDPIRGDMGFRTIFGDGPAETDFTAGVTELEPGGWMAEPST